MPAWLLAFQLMAGDTVAVPTPAHDRWLGADKVKHFVVSMAAQGASYAAMRSVADHREALVGATVTTAALGLFKERRDRTGTGFSVRDLAWDAAGILVASFILSRTPHS